MGQLWENIGRTNSIGLSSASPFFRLPIVGSPFSDISDSVGCISHDIPMICPMMGPMKISLFWWHSHDIPMIFPWDTKQGYWREYHGGHQDIYGHQDSGVYSHDHWIGLRDNLQETMGFDHKIWGVPVPIVPEKQIQRSWYSNDISHDISL